MTFLINGIQQSGSQQVRLTFLLQASSLAIVKSFLEHAGIVVLSISPYTQEVSSYAPAYIRFSYAEEEFIMISSLSLEDLCFFIVSLGLPVSEVNTYTDPKSPEHLSLVIQSAQEKYLSVQHQRTLQDQKKKEVEKKFFNDERISKAKEIIAWIIPKAALVMENYSSYLSSKELKNLKDKIEELKKQKMGTNYEKISEILQEVLLVLVATQKAALATRSDQASPLFDKTQVTDIDLEGELLTLEKVKKQLVFGGPVSAIEKDYEVFGKSIIFLRFLKKDVFDVFSHVPFLLFASFDALEFFALSVLSLLGVFFVLSGLFSGKFSSSLSASNALRLDFFAFGLFGLLVFGIKKMRRQNIIILMSLLLLLVVVYFSLFSLLKHSFSLT